MTYCCLSDFGMLLAIFVSTSDLATSLTGQHQHESVDRSRLRRNTESSSEIYFGCECEWSKWMNNDDYGPFVGDDNTYKNLRRNHEFCQFPKAVECRNAWNPHIPFFHIKQDEVDCNVTHGLLCVSRPKNQGFVNPQNQFYCDDYEIRVLCCDCPQITLPSTIAVNVTSNHTSFADGTINPTDIEQVPDEIDYVLPLSIIAIIIVSMMVIFGIIICVVKNSNKCKKAKSSQDYMEGATYTQRPVSFTDFDRRGSSLPSIPATPQHERKHLNYNLTQLDGGRLQFLYPQKNSHPTVVKLRDAASDPLVEPKLEARQWLPDEFERSLEKQQGAKGMKKSLFSSSFSPANKNIPYMDEENVGNN